MKYKLEEIPEEWRDFAKEHQFADNSVLDANAFGHDDLLARMLDAKAQGKRLPPKQRKNLARNRGRCHRERLIHLVERYAPLAKRFYEFDFLKALIVAEEVAEVRRLTSAREWQLLWLVRAENRTYRQAGELAGMTTTALKSAISRCESRLLSIVSPV